MSESVSRQHVLVVEDDADIAEALSIVFAALGYPCQTAASGSAGLAAASHRWPDVVFIDLGLPDMPGVELAVRLRAQRPDQPLYVVAMTGFSALDRSKPSIAAAFDEYLVKPVAPEVLASSVARARARHAGRG